LRRLVTIHERAPDQRADPGHSKRGGAHLGAVDGFAPLPVHNHVPLDQPKTADVRDGSKSLPPGEEVVGTRRAHARLGPMPEVQPDDAISIGERHRRIGDPLNDLERAGPDGDCDGHRQAPDHREHRIPGQHPESHLDVQPRQSHAHRASAASVAQSLPGEMQRERHRLPPIASPGPRQSVPPAIALEDFVQIARDGLAHVGRQRVLQ
jgi:hypothetical protein